MPISRKRKNNDMNNNTITIIVNKMYLAYFHSLLVIFVDSIHFIKNLRHIIYFD